MIPLRDDAPRTTVPYATWFLIALNTVVFIFELLLAPGDRQTFFFQFGVVPDNVSHFFGGAHAIGMTGVFLPFVTSMFLHAGWLHLIANMWALYIFGDNVEDRLGHFRYLLFYGICGIIASAAHAAFNLDSTVPSVGASGAIAGIMGAYFLLFPSARVLTFIPFFFIYLTWLPAWVVLGYWFLVQFLSGTFTSLVGNADSGGVAFWAHVGGFIAGLALINLFPAARRSQVPAWYE